MSLFLRAVSLRAPSTLRRLDWRRHPRSAPGSEQQWARDGPRVPRGHQSLTIYSMYALGWQRSGRRSAPLRVLRWPLLGPRICPFAAGVRIFHGFSGCVAYVISVGDIFRNIISQQRQRTAVPEGIHRQSPADGPGVALRDDATGDPEAR
ncbi:hypothetical protein TcBrA4_0053430 [Trypanosoma cruzi]|nr:hypothetical protein TcBrA4_0053430 [Trypanosoma cruzi]